MRLTLKKDGYPFAKIMHGRKWIGRVVKTADGRYYARIGNHIEAYASDELSAFRAAGAKALGFESLDHLHSHNSAIRQQRKASRARASYAMSEILRGNFKPLDELFGRTERAAERQVRKIEEGQK
jgi:hypothetical protein